MGMQHMLTTVDNPYSPFSQFDEWFAFDTRKGYNTSGLLARIVVTSSELSESDQSVAIELAIEEIVRENVSGMHRSVVADDYTATG
jgi:hypothetical protein